MKQLEQQQLEQQQLEQQHQLEQQLGGARRRKRAAASSLDLPLSRLVVRLDLAEVALRCWLSAAMSRRARPGGEAGGPRRSQLGCHRRARRRTALLEMGVPPIEQHGGGGWRVGKRKIRSVAGFSEIRKKRPVLPCPGKPRQ